MKPGRPVPHWAALLRNLSDARRKAEYEAKQRYPVIRSRGLTLKIWDSIDVCLYEERLDNWQAQIRRLVNECLNREGLGLDDITVELHGGFDGADRILYEWDVDEDIINWHVVVPREALS